MGTSVFSLAGLALGWTGMAASTLTGTAAGSGVGKTVRVANIGLVCVGATGKSQGRVCNSAKCTSNTARLRLSQIFKVMTLLQ
jgi:hypothetical protein